MFVGGLVWGLWFILVFAMSLLARVGWVVTFSDLFCCLECCCIFDCFMILLLGVFGVCELLWFEFGFVVLTACRLPLF